MVSEEKLLLFIYLFNQILVITFMRAGKMTCYGADINLGFIERIFLKGTHIQLLKSL